jgi:nicotinamidase-related amidase
MNPELTRRDAVATSLAAAATMFSGLSQVIANPPKVAPQLPDRISHLHIKPRYHRWHVAPGVDWIETNTSHATLDWQIPLQQAAIVLVDVWDHHYLKDTEARAETVITEKLVPLLTACRTAKMPIVHAPSPPMAKQHPNWVRLVGENEMMKPRAEWPPAEFLNQPGVYQSYRRPKEPREPEIVQLSKERKLHPKVQPVGDEPVVATGEELHRYCQQRGILFLLFAGFNTNACILVRDYGTLAMSDRGYEVILIRDCTTGMESRDTQPALSQTCGAVLFLEMFGKYSITSDEIMAGLPSNPQ